MHNFLHLSLMFGGVPKMRDLEVAFVDEEDDWIRISAFSWLIWTPKDPNVIYNRLLPLLDVHDQFLITQVVPGQMAGMLPQWSWDWVNRKVPGTVQIKFETQKFLRKD